MTRSLVTPLPAPAVNGATQSLSSWIMAPARALGVGALALLVAASPLLPRSAWAQGTGCEADASVDPPSDAPQGADRQCADAVTRSFAAIKAYITTPAHWNRTDWLLFGGSLAAIGVAYHFDDQVRTHFVGNSPSALSSANTGDLQDALPAAALFVGTFGYANLIDDDSGRRESRTMLEATALSLGTAYLLKYASGRERPDQTADPNRWRAGGGSFPSVHATAAFAIGTVLAESGNDRYRWIRRALGYGVAGFTAYERLDHNAHWLSDTVAGAVLGAATAHFAMHRSGSANQTATLQFAPLYRGVMVTYTAHLP